MTYVDFWADDKKWPDDAYGYVFLARALRIAGAALYSDWEDRDPLTPQPLDLWLEIGGGRFLKPQKDVGNATKDEVRKLLAAHAPEKLSFVDSADPELQPLRNAKDSWRPHVPLKKFTQVLSPESWRAGAEIAKLENDKRRAALDRFVGAQNFLKTAMRDGKLTFVLQPSRGGSPSKPMPADWWNTKSVAVRFKMCRMSARDPFGVAHAGEGFQDIFVSAAELEIMLKSAIPLSRPKSSEEMETLRAKASITYDEMLKLEGASPSRNAFEVACKKQGISTTIAREVHGQKYAQRPRN
ncbi:hypothetical protein [Rhizobium hidalgonense]|uniref:hypothetical protein n=1 Tax=Rhizobium hidalgonense TaxID=1538159 RepID=UPI0028725A89|nr:hypothetical protein [Rhizobium hidalgonense]MDR9808203.1 hypothetical protein [Rhizobium hidalgonense]